MELIKVLTPETDRKIGEAADALRIFLTALTALIQSMDTKGLRIVTDKS